MATRTGAIGLVFLALTGQAFAEAPAPASASPPGSLAGVIMPISAQPKLVHVGFRRTPLKRALDMLMGERDYSYIIAPEVADLAVTAKFDTTVEDALTALESSLDIDIREVAPRVYTVSPRVHLVAVHTRIYPIASYYPEEPPAPVKKRRLVFERPVVPQSDTPVASPLVVPPVEKPKVKPPVPKVTIRPHKAEAAVTRREIPGDV